MSDAAAWQRLHRQITSCQLCPRLREHCTQIATVKRRAYADQTYWGRPVSGFGDVRARIWIVGLAPGAHGANRTGRVFTGDRSGDFLYAALHRAGLANQPDSTHRDDGLQLRDVFISAAARCAPPDNKPTPQELHQCFEYLIKEWQLLARKRVIIALGRIAWDAATRLIAKMLPQSPEGKAEFGHAAEVRVGSMLLIGSYHVSQQNTFTGRLTPESFDLVLRRAQDFAERGEPSGVGALRVAVGRRGVKVRQ